MADPSRTAVSVVAVIAIVILVGLAIYFVMEQTDDDLEIDIGLHQVEGPPAPERGVQVHFALPRVQEEVGRPA